MPDGSKHGFSFSIYSASSLDSNAAESELSLRLGDLSLRLLLGDLER